MAKLSNKSGYVRVKYVVFVHTGHDITAMLLTHALKPLGCPGGPLSGKHPVFDLEWDPLVCCNHR